MHLHPSGFSEVFEKRTINNIYLDFHDLQNLYNNVDGLHDRKKHRIRWYGSTFGQIASPVLEIKIKNGLLGSKLSYPLNAFCLDRHYGIRDLDTVVSPSSDTAKPMPRRLRDQIQSMKPMLLNSYDRVYFLSADKRYRITVDSELRYYKIASRNNSFLHSLKLRRSVILELKYSDQHDGGAAHITSRLPFRVTKSSKYVEGVERLAGIV